jgi:hypothetical protein
MTACPSPPGPTPDAFVQRLGAANPFLANRVDRVLGGDFVDVPEIHQAEFQQILDLGRLALEEDRGVGVVVWGEAGIGKSHLLSRFARWAPGRACFVYLHNLQASPERLPRYVVKCVLSVLTGGQAGPLWRTELFRLVNAAVRAALGGGAVKAAPWSAIEPAYHRWIHALGAPDAAPGVLLDRTVQGVLLRFFRAAHPRAPDGDEDVARLAVHWLAGDPLDPAEARRIGVRPDHAGDEVIALPDNQHVKHVLVGLTRLARSAGRLCVLCFDQADNLDEDQVRALSRFLHDLLDTAGSLLVVTTGVRQTLLAFQQRGVITETSWDRIGQFTVLLGRIRAPEGRALLAARLAKFLEPVASLPEIRALRGKDALFPLGSAWYEQRVGHLADFRPRDLLTWAGERWQALQAGLAGLPPEDWLERWPAVPEGKGSRPEGSLEEAIDRKVDEKLAEQAALRQRQPETLPPSEENLAGLVHELLRQCVGRAESHLLADVRQVAPPRPGSRPAYDLLVSQWRNDGTTGQLGVRFLCTTSAISAAGSLRRLVNNPDRAECVLLVTDERQPMSLGNRGSEYLKELGRPGPRQFRLREIAFADYVALDALQAVVGLARAGDLEVEFPHGRRRPVSEVEVIASHHRRQRYRALPLLRELLDPVGMTAQGSAVPTTGALT